MRNKDLQLVTDLSFIAGESAAKTAENEAFRDFLKHSDIELDSLVHELNGEIEPLIDCTACGNCCRSLMINVSADEAQSLAERLHTSLAAVKEKYLEESTGGMLVINTIPCHFLADNKCTIYENRFADCREFPHLHKNGFHQRIFGTLMHYGRCPIIYNVMEALKQHTKFVPELK
ncbi:hypothetical protein BC349_00230 [Flavihumibacter stibioxidans]|uniref:YkgJ family cysteine cluster protein n=2 Tax=Flavihumibacter stibioxidans TaxID=1834163 RepID=A0ABR7M2Y3_9BACT|nr:hypothetical protein [Flavihumibacter stibioxidans]